MKIAADENIFNPIIDYLVESDHEVLNLKSSEFSGILDDEVYKIACNENRIIITMDKDFTRMFRFPPINCGGIIVLKIYRFTIIETLKFFKKHFNALKEDDIKNNLVILTTDGIRIRKSKAE